MQGDPPVLLDEWQRVPTSWDLVRRAVDDDPTPGRFLLTGSAAPVGGGTHSGAGRIVRLRMRPLTLAERGIDVPTVSLGELLSGGRPPLQGSTSISLDTYATEICRSGFPGLRGLATGPGAPSSTATSTGSSIVTSPRSGSQPVPPAPYDDG